MANKGIFWPATDTCGRLVITDELPEWVMEEMPFCRTMGDMLLLPTGEVLIINDGMNGTAAWYVGREPALNSVMYLTENRTFEVLTPAVIPKLYHSMAILLLDGRVLVGGSNPNEKYEFTQTRGRPYLTKLSLEAFNPPYLGPMAPQPTIMAVRPGTKVRYGEILSIEWTMRGEWKGVRVTMVAPSFSTHSFSMNQRLLVLEVEGVWYVFGRSYAVDVISPATVTLAPSGYYLVFLVHGGFPSHGTWVHIMPYSHDPYAMLAGGEEADDSMHEQLFKHKTLHSSPEP